MFFISKLDHGDILCNEAMGFENGQKLKRKSTEHKKFLQL